MSKSWMLASPNTGAVSGDVFTVVGSGPGGGLLGDNDIDIMGTPADPEEILGDVLPYENLRSACRQPTRLSSGADPLVRSKITPRLGEKRDALER